MSNLFKWMLGLMAFTPFMMILISVLEVLW